MTPTIKASDWTALTRKLKVELDDGALLKALAKAEKAAGAGPEEQAAALDALAVQARKQSAALAKLKKEMDDKAHRELKDRLQSIEAAAEAHIKALDKAAKAGDDEEADTPALLTDKMLPLLRELRKGETTMHALVCTAGRNTAVLIMRRPITSSRRTLLAEAVDAKGGARYLGAQCLLENQALTFVVQSAASGLAVRIREALHKQTGLRLKVRVRGDDGAAEEDGQDDADAPATKARDAAAQPHPLAAAYTQQRQRLEPRLKAALQARHPESAKLAALLTLAEQRAGKERDYAGAIRALDELAKLLLPQAAAQPAAPKAERGIQPGLVNLQKARLAWVQTRQAVQSQLKQLEESILEEYRDDEDLDSVKRDVRRLDDVMAVLDEELVDTLDAALQAADPAERNRLQLLAREQLDGYSSYVAADDFVGKLDANPFTPVKIRETVTRSAAALSNALIPAS